MNLNKSTALTLRIGIAIGIALMAAGLAFSMSGHGDSVLYAGMLVLIVSPFAGVVVSLAALISAKDWYWAAVAAILLGITMAGAVAALL